MVTEPSPSPVVPSDGSAVRDLALVAVFAAFIAVLGLVPPIQPIASISPITAQTLGVMLAGSILGARRGALAVVVFLVLVAAGLPLLAGGRGGLSVFTGKSAGFLVGWVVGAWVTGWLVEYRPARRPQPWILAATVIGGIAVVYAFGLPVLAAVAGLPLTKAAVLMSVYVPGDLVKAVVATVVTAGVLRGYPTAVVPSRRAGALLGS